MIKRVRLALLIAVFFAASSCSPASNCRYLSQLAEGGKQGVHPGYVGDYAASGMTAEKFNRRVAEGENRGVNPGYVGNYAASGLTAEEFNRRVAEGEKQGVPSGYVGAYAASACRAD